MPNFPDGFDLVTDEVAITDRVLRITHPRVAEDLIDEAEYEEDERLPYWADLWPSGIVLARHLAGLDLTGLRIVEMGAGLGLPSIVAASGGADVLATDWYGVALEFAQGLVPGRMPSLADAVANCTGISIMLGIAAVRARRREAAACSPRATRRG